VDIVTISSPIARLDVLDAHVCVVDIPIAIAEIDRWVWQGHRSYATLIRVHGVMDTAQKEFVRRTQTAARLVLQNGMPRSTIR
jgi:hypothetical protein